MNVRTRSEAHSVMRNSPYPIGLKMVVSLKSLQKSYSLLLAEIIPAEMLKSILMISALSMTLNMAGCVTLTMKGDTKGYSKKLIAKLGGSCFMLGGIMPSTNNRNSLTSRLAEVHSASLHFIILKGALLY